MKIAYISYEHPLGNAGGGIGTYIGQISKLMATRGHHVEVFTGNGDIAKDTSITHDGYLLHLIACNDAIQFRTNVLEKFTERESITSFDIMESAEYNADALLVKKTFPNIPLTVKLHTPTFLVNKLNNYQVSALSKMRFIIGGLLRGKIVKPYWTATKNNDLDLEKELFNMADSVYSPSNSLKTIVNENWGPKPIQVIPNPFIPSPDFLAIAPLIARKKFNIAFIGRLERRKGILDLMNAIPLIIDKNVDVEFTFIGKSLESPKKGLLMEAYMIQHLKNYREYLNFKGFVTYNQLPDLLKEVDICIFPSLWENFPTVCLEAMLAGKAVIGTDNGGMADMITNEVNGLLIPPNAPQKIATAVLELVNNGAKLKQIGDNAKAHILATYNGQKIGKMVEDLYLTTIQK